MSYKVPLSSVIVLLKTLNSSFSTYWFVWCLNRWDVVAAGRTAPDSRVSSVAPFEKTKPSSPSLKFVGSRASSGAASQPAGTTHKPPCGPSPFEGAFHCGSCCLASCVSGLQADGSRQESLLPLRDPAPHPERAPVSQQWSALCSARSPAFAAVHHTPATWIGRGGSYSALIQEFPLSSRAVARSLVSTLKQTLGFNWVILFPLAADSGISWWLFCRCSSQKFIFKVQQSVLQKGRLFLLCKFETAWQWIYLYD